MDLPATQTPGKARILDAAVELTAEGGVARATISAVCERAGIRPPALYYHYGSKDGLVGAVVEAVAGAWLEELRASVVAESDSLQELVAGALRGWRAAIVAPQSPVELLLRVQLERADHAPPIRDALRRVTARARAIIADALDAVAGPLHNPDAVAQLVVSLVQGAALRHHLDRDERELERRLAEVGEALLALVVAQRVGGTRRPENEIP